MLSVEESKIEVTFSGLSVVFSGRDDGEEDIGNVDTGTLVKSIIFPPRCTEPNVRHPMRFREEEQEEENKMDIDEVAFPPSVINSIIKKRSNLLIDATVSTRIVQPRLFLKLDIDHHTKEKFLILSKEQLSKSDSSSIQLLEIVRSSFYDNKVKRRTLAELCWLMKLIRTNLSNLQELRLTNVGRCCNSGKDTVATSTTVKENNSIRVNIDNSTNPAGSKSQHHCDEIDILCNYLLKNHRTLTTIHLHVVGRLPDYLLKTLSTIQTLKIVHLHLEQGCDAGALIGSSPSLRELYIHSFHKKDYNHNYHDKAMILYDIKDLMSIFQAIQKNKSLQVLDLGYRFMICDLGVRVMAHALRTNTSLREMYFSYGPTSSQDSIAEKNHVKNQQVVSNRVLEELVICLGRYNTTLENLINHTSEMVLVDDSYRASTDWLKSLQQSNPNISRFIFFQKQNQNQQGKLRRRKSKRHKKRRMLSSSLSPTTSFFSTSASMVTSQRNNTTTCSCTTVDWCTS